LFCFNQHHIIPWHLLHLPLPSLLLLSNGDTTIHDDLQSDRFIANRTLCDWQGTARAEEQVAAAGEHNGTLNYTKIVRKSWFFLLVFQVIFDPLKYGENRKVFQFSPFKGFLFIFALLNN
jgi:hypothetical protein